MLRAPHGPRRSFGMAGLSLPSVEWSDQRTFRRQTKLTGNAHPGLLPLLPLTQTQGTSQRQTSQVDSERSRARGESGCDWCAGDREFHDRGITTAQQGRSLISTRRRLKLQAHCPARRLQLQLAIRTALDPIAPVGHTPRMPEVTVFHLWETFEMRYRQCLLNRRRTTHPVLWR
jgi:hypothetical protein